MRRVRLDDVQKDSSRVKDETEETSSREVVSAFFSFSFSSGDADREGTHRLRDEEREDAGDGGAAGHAAVDESARREETRGGVGCQSGCASSRVATFRGSAGKIKWDRARHVLGGHCGCAGDGRDGVRNERRRPAGHESRSHPKRSQRRREESRRVRASRGAGLYGQAA